MINDCDRIDPDVTAALRALDAATPGIENDAIEQRLRSAFAQHHRARALRVRRVQQWMPAAAAGLVLTCAGAGFWLAGTPTTPPQPPPLVAAARGGIVPFARPATPSIDVRAIPASPARVERQDSLGDPLDEAIGAIADFIPLPGAAALPAFERGDIVRIEVPVAGLPAYGLDMVPDATPTSVAADLLIGQDGVPRAIRLASDRFQ